MAYVPTTNGQNAATAAGNNQAGLASPITALQASIAGGNQAPAAFIDGVLSVAAAYQGRNQAQISAGTTFVTASSWVSYGPSWSFTPPITKTYLVHFDSTVVCNAAGAAGACYLGLLIGATLYNDAPNFVHATPAMVAAAGLYLNYHTTYAVPLTAGTPVSFVLQANGPSLNAYYFDASCYRRITVI